MSRWFESLESRMLLSALPPQALTILADAKTLKSDVKALRADLKQDLKTAHTDLKTLNADLRSSHTAQNRTLLLTLKTDENACISTLNKDLAAVSSKGTGDVRRVLADDKKLLKIPSDSAARAQLSTDLATLQTDTDTTTFSTDVAACQTMQNTDLAAIGSANPTSTGTDVATAEANAATSRTTLDAGIATLNTDLATFRTDAANV